MKKSVFIRFQLPGVHRWPRAPENVRYLRNEHRHLFYFECEAVVEKPDREIEFIQLQTQVMNLVANEFWDVGLSLADFKTMSCEQIGQWVLDKVPVLSGVSVFEDDENGAVIVR